MSLDESDGGIISPALVLKDSVNCTKDHQVKCVLCHSEFQTYDITKNQINTQAEAETIFYSVPMFDGIVELSPVCRACYYKAALVRGRTFGVRGNIRKAVVLKRENNLVTWSFISVDDPAINTVEEIINASDGIYDIQMDFLAEVENSAYDRQLPPPKGGGMS